MIPGLTLDRPLVIFDLETTGLETSTARIVELGFRMHPVDGDVKEYRTLVQPGISIPLETVAVHHITDVMIASCRKCGHKSDSIHDDEFHEFQPWPTFAQLAPRLAKGFEGCDFAGKNVRYDLEVLCEEFVRHGVDWSYASARVIDLDRYEQLGEPRDLSNLYRRRTGKEPHNAHSALDDVQMTEEILVEQVRLFDRLPHSVAELHELMWPGWVDSTGKVRKRDGVCALTFGKWRGVPLKNVPRSYWEWVGAQNFTADFKKIAADAAMGVYP